jgi:di/tricarboxylate transporter
VVIAGVAGLVAAEPARAIAWALSGFSNTVVWLIFAAFMLADAYGRTGLGRRIGLVMIRLLGRRTLGLAYAIALSDLVLAPFTPSNTARSGGTIYPVLENLPPLYDSLPGGTARKIGAYLTLAYTLGLMGILTPYATGPSPIYFGSGYVSSPAFWGLGAILGAVFLGALLVIGVLLSDQARASVLRYRPARRLALMPPPASAHRRETPPGYRSGASFRALPSGIARPDRARSRARRPVIETLPTQRLDFPGPAPLSGPWRLPCVDRHA